jgi:hypothetical protein
MQGIPPWISYCLFFSVAIGCNSSSEISSEVDTTATSSNTLAPSNTTTAREIPSIENVRPSIVASQAKAPVVTPVASPTGSATSPARPEINSPFILVGTAQAPPNDLANAFVGNPFEGATRLDAADLSGSATAFVKIVREVVGHGSSTCNGYVFAKDDKRSYIVAEDFRGGAYSAKEPSKVLQYTYRALVGWGSAMRTVRLEEVRRYAQPHCIVLAAPTKELPPPLPASDDVAPEPGRRLRIVGHPFHQSFDMEREITYSRVVEPAEVIVLPKELEEIRLRAKSSSTFVVACAPEVQLEEGLVLDESLAPIALALKLPNSERGQLPDAPKLFACFPVGRLRAFGGPHLMYFTAMWKTAGEGATADLVVQCLEPHGPLRNLRVYVGSQWLELSPEPRPTPDWRVAIYGLAPVEVPQPSMFAPYTGRPTKSPIVGGKWTGAPSDVQEVKLISSPTTSVLFTQQWSRPSHPQAPFPDGDVSSWPGLKTYLGKITLAKFPESKFCFMQCVYDDDHGVAQVLGTERTAAVGSHLR